jgi:N-acylglucosamine 2-epimerase
MVNLRIATQVLQRQPDPEISSIAGQCLEAIIDRHFNPEIGLNNELLHFDFSRVEGEERKSLFGHAIETLWMVMDEALRCDDLGLWDVCAERIHRHLEVGWDHVYGGLAHMVNVDGGGYVWPSERPVGTDYDFRFVGEYHYMKSMWALTEVLIATLKVYERTEAEWAARFFSLAQETIDTKFSLPDDGLPGYILFGDRKVTRHEHVARQDNYHPPRQLMLNIQTLDRMLGEF